VKFPAVNFIHSSATRSGRKLTQVIENCYPGRISSDSNIDFRWGQNTKLDLSRTTVIFDCGYFYRRLQDRENRHYRISINEFHPTNLPDAPRDRWESLGLKLYSRFDPKGPIILVGRGGKTKRQNGGIDWETKALRKIRKVYPGKKVIYRPKVRRRQRATNLPGCVLDYASTIEKLCDGASLVVTQWSNIGNEALRFGIPVVTEGGPASDICPNEIKLNQEPFSIQYREKYFHRLAYWQWSIREFKEGKVWPWLFEQIGRVNYEN